MASSFKRYTSNGNCKVKHLQPQMGISDSDLLRNNEATSALEYEENKLGYLQTPVRKESESSDSYSGISSGIALDSSARQIKTVGTESTTDTLNNKKHVSGAQDTRTKINFRERKRMHDLNTAMDGLREVIPYANGPSVRKLSKIATLTLARNYIQMLTKSLDELKAMLNEFQRVGRIGSLATGRPLVPCYKLGPGANYITSSYPADARFNTPYMGSNMWCRTRLVTGSSSSCTLNCGTGQACYLLPRREHSSSAMDSYPIEANFQQTTVKTSL